MSPIPFGLRGVLAALLLCAASRAADGDPAGPKREPRYEHSPRYALLHLGAENPVPVWIVEDGRKLYVDRNANGDLTDDGPPVKATDERSFTGPTGAHWDFNYRIAEFTTSPGHTHRDFDLRHWNYGDPEDQYGLSLSLDGKVPMYAGWNSLLKPKPAEAPILHFGRSVAPRMLRAKTFPLGTTPSRFSIAFTNPDFSKHHDARLSIEAFPASSHPSVTIEWPVAPGAAALKTRHILDERCCYWEFYTTRFDVPAAVVAGMARVTVMAPLDFPLPLDHDSFDVPVVANP